MWRSLGNSRLIKCAGTGRNVQDLPEVDSKARLMEWSGKVVREAAALGRVRRSGAPAGQEGEFC